MKKEEMLKIFELVEVEQTSFLPKETDKVSLKLDLWYSVFQDFDKNEVFKAVLTALAKTVYPLKISDVYQQIKKADFNQRVSKIDEYLADIQREYQNRNYVTVANMFTKFRYQMSPSDIEFMSPKNFTYHKTEFKKMHIELIKEDVNEEIAENMTSKSMKIENNTQIGA